ncbi:uncharacterized protein FA14DRAFT_179624 [Meira miltonrushii]|uniref:Uncharacterized protein n=1 Tax=Meira miltonrushii TaxID=1280837 RepID=A0A316VL51_9BASI|nr:uncharacterized protein FA14DRAFT_179624 [Meira miltonrushii]PWN36265.1 hypothetical protein FA14DRAFT_179624 [Meira miltonrushii]
MIANAAFVMALIFMNACALTYYPSANALPIKSGPYGGNEHPFKRDQADDDSSMSLYTRSPLPNPNDAFHTVSVNSLEVMGATPDMLLPKHANPKKGKMSVFLKRSNDDLENDSDFQKRFYALDEVRLRQGKITKEEAKKHVEQQMAWGEHTANASKEKPFKKRFFAGQQLAVLHGTMTPSEASESVQKQLNLFKHH